MKRIMGERPRVVDIVFVSGGILIAMCILSLTGSSGKKLSNEDMAGVMVGKPVDPPIGERKKCCTPSLKVKCENDPVLACMASPPCSNAVDVHSNCPDTTCQDSFYDDVCVRRVNVWVGNRCHETGNAISTDCPSQEQRCEYTTSMEPGLFNACDTEGSICIWAGDICPF